jgi:hypothetical protein
MHLVRSPVAVTIRMILQYNLSQISYLKKVCILMFVGPCIILQFIKKNPTRCNNVSKFYYSTFMWSSTCFGRHTAHHQEPKTALAASGFSYVKGCWSCRRWTLSSTVCLTTSTTSLTSDTFIKYQLNAHCFIHIFDTYLLRVSVLVHHHQGEQLCHLLEKPTAIMTFLCGGLIL